MNTKRRRACNDQGTKKARTKARVGSERLKGDRFKTQGEEVAPVLNLWPVRLGFRYIVGEDLRHLQSSIFMSEPVRRAEDATLSEAVENTVGLQPWRRVFHAANGTFVVLAIGILGLGVPAARMILCALLVLAVVLDIVRLIDPKANVLFFRTFAPLASPREAKKIASSTWYVLSTLMVLWLFPTPYALAGILVLAWADPAASVVGQTWGKVRFLAGTMKGTLTFFLAAVCALLFFVPFPTALLTAAVTAAVEAAPIDLDDNLIVPLTVAGTLMLIGG